MYKMFPETLECWVSKPRYKPECLAWLTLDNGVRDKDGTYFNKGVEQKLKGTLKPTKVKPKKKTKKT